MYRRQYLLLTAGVTGLAGCSGVLDDGESDTTDPTDVRDRRDTTTAWETEPTPTTATTARTETTQTTPEVETEAETQTTAETETTKTRTTTESTPPSEALAITEIEYPLQTPNEDDNFARIDVVNTTDRDLQFPEVEIRFLDEDDDVILSSDADIRTVLGGDTWRIYAKYHEDPSVEDVTATFEDRSDPLEHVPPDGATVTDSELVEDRYGNPDVVGKVETTTEFDYLEAICTFYDEDGYLRSAGRTNETDVPADSTWEFRAEGQLSDFGGNVTDYEVLLTVD
ncbi:FxLYD domain-containing protein [Halorussus halobius]|uniref:FxLYD domain-containing protein n=1 Tax=Halorussus halobius TaxID=1710537 RepID=UPI0010927B0D|nr:FxLYD domain-containing protein [Halorussus halobius]